MGPRHSSEAELSAWLAWLRAPGAAGAVLRAALARYGSADSARQAALSAPAEHGLSEAGRAALARPQREQHQRDRAWLDAPGHHLLTLGDDDYPPLLARCPDAPPALFVAGELEPLWLPQLAIVGSRNASAAGLEHARSFAQALSRTGLTIVSGLALGIDAAAHAAVLDAGGKTVAVCATGLDQVYPERHRELAARIRAQGALVSEFPLGVTARADHFPRRNRIIAGLALGTLVIEASLRSGSLITARLAGERGREVFALPGSLHHPLARGCHRLIREGATLVESADDVLEPLRPQLRGLRASLGQDDADADAAPAPPPAPAPARDADYRRLLDALGHDPATLDELAERSRLDAAALASMLLILELDGEVAALAGARYARTRTRALGTVSLDSSSPTGID
jgi:DNA processing protein